jgi:capsular polysaccharide biosynthesis protein
MRDIYYKTVNSLVELLKKSFREDKYVLQNSIITILNTFSNKARFTVLKSSWLDQENEHCVQELRQSSKAIIYGPNIIGEGQKTAEVDVPQINFYTFKGAIVTDNSASIIVKDRIIIERSPNVDTDLSNFSSGHLSEHTNSKALVRINKISKIDKGIFISGNGSSNYFHWLIEIMPKLEFISELEDKYQEYPLLMSNKVKQIPSFKDAVDMLNLKNPIIYLDRYFSYQVKDLCYITTPNMILYNTRGSNFYKTDYFWACKDSINFLRNEILTKVNYTKTASKVYFARKNKRRNFNDDELWELLQPYGFIKVYMESLTFMEQVNLMRNAKYIVGPTGASWTNIIFCDKGNKGLCWQDRLITNFSAFSHLANMVSFKLDYIIVYNSEAKITSDVFSSSYHIDLKIVKQWLEKNIDEYT